jgi:peptidoglycan/LPS O-acetylase OafA/YrhL
MAASARARNAVAALTVVGTLLVAAATWRGGERRIETLKGRYGRNRVRTAFRAPGLRAAVARTSAEPV